MKNYTMIARQSMRLFMLSLLTCITFSLQAQFTGNPILNGADPEIHYFAGKYYIYPTASGGKQFHAYSSYDLTNWQDEGVIFDIGPGCSWAEVNGWAPGVVYRNNKYYLYYTAEVKIGVAISDSPTGPFVDLGYPLIGTDPFTVDIIDAQVFIDDDGQAYMYYGGSNGSQMGIRKLNADMISFSGAPVNGTPPNYTEGPFMLKRKGVYYLMYSNGAWYNDSYNVQYCTASSPMGPWTYRGRILSSNAEDKGPGHHSVIKMGNCDEYYICYHRYENGLGGSRVLAIDHMYFNSAGLIVPVNMTNYGVQARMPDQACPSDGIVSGGIYKLKHKGTNQCLDVLNNSSAEGADVQQYQDNGNDAQRWVITLEADGYYKLTHKGTDMVLDVDNNSSQSGADVRQWRDNGSNAQRWKLEAMSDGYYKLTHKGTNQCLDVAGNSGANNANVAQWVDNGNDAQRWELTLIEVPVVQGGVYRLTHKGTNQCLDVENNSPNSGANVRQWTDNGNDAQRWIITREADGFYKLTHRGTNQCLDVGNNSSAEGTNVAQWVDNGNDAQRWKIELMPDGYHKLTHKNTNQCLDVAGNSSEPGTNVIQWTDNGNDAQRWKLDLVPVVTPVEGTGDGLTGSYYNGMNFETPVLTRKDANLNLDWGNSAPATGVNADQFSARWSGQVQPRYSGDYTFYINSDNGRRVWVNNQLIIDEWADNWKEPFAGTITLTAGVKYDIKVEYFENNGGAFVKLEWASLFQAREVIPTSQLYSNPAPTVSIGSPANNATFALPAAVNINVTASDNGSVAKVDFYNGNTWLGSDNSAPFTYTWNNIGLGVYTVKVIATDNSGAFTISAPVSITVTNDPNVNPLPVVSLSSNVSSANAPAQFVFTAMATDGDGIAKVEFYNGSTLLVSKTTAPYTYTWTNVSAGTYSVTALATDTKGGATMSSAVTVKSVAPNIAPTVSISAPANNASYNAPASITFTANAADTDGNVTKVEYFNGASSIGSATSGSYSVSWNNVAAGTYTITAKATDNAGAVTTSSAITVVVKTVVTNPCTGVAQYKENGGYVDGTIVQNAGNRYKCKPYPFTGWCNGASWAYAPGTGSYWQDAWTLVGSCVARMSAAQSSQALFSPNPTSGLVRLELDEVSYVSVYNTYGVEVMAAQEVHAQGNLDLSNLPAGMYMLRVVSGSEVLTQTVIKK